MNIKDNLFFTKTFFYILIIILGLIILVTFLGYLKFSLMLNLIITILAMVISLSVAFLVYFGNQRIIHNREMNEQIKLIEGLLAELDVLEGNNQEIFGGEITRGNLDWYKEVINSKKDYLEILDHKINHLNIELYFTKLDSNLCSNLEMRKFIRHLSNINDKISQLNHHIFKKKNRKDKKYLLKIIDETLPKINILREILRAQKNNLQKIKI